jgi:peptidoglycan/LPS O-acetylase OafA/YrhL
MRNPVGTFTFPPGGCLVAGGCLLAMAVMYPFTDRLVDTNPYVYTIGFTLLGLLFAYFIAFAIVNPTGRLSRFLSTAPLRWLGKYSYAIYIFHPFFISAARLSRGWPLPLKFVPELFATLVAAWLSWNLFEKHFLKLKRYFEPRHSTPAKTADPVSDKTAVLANS